jgi:mannose-6-phosphate isomerase-like protein (cupin superfamily)
MVQVQKHIVVETVKVPEVHKVLGAEVIVRVDSDETGGRYAIIEATTPPKSGPPAHVHENEDEIFQVLEGQFEITCGDKSFIATKGHVAVATRGTPHSFRNVGTGNAKLLTTITPGGFERFFVEVGREVREMPADMEKLMRISRKYGVAYVD